MKRKSPAVREAERITRGGRPAWRNVTTGANLTVIGIAVTIIAAVIFMILAVKNGQPNP